MGPHACTQGSEDPGFSGNLSSIKDLLPILEKKIVEKMSRINARRNMGFVLVLLNNLF